jgi:hypothetical protein
MSEDQLHNEIERVRENQEIIRLLINESNADLSQQIRVANEKTLELVKHDNKQIEENVRGMIKSAFGIFQWIMGMFLVLVLGFGGWLALDHLTLKSEHKELKSDFGMVLKSTAADHSDCVGFQELVDKYFPSRGTKQ